MKETLYISLRCRKYTRVKMRINQIGQVQCHFFKAASSSVLSDYDSKTLQKQNTDVCLWSVSGTPGQWEPMRNYSNHLEKHL